MFDSDANYVGFLAQRMPEEQKRALAESPAAPDYIPAALRARARAEDAEERLLRQLLLPAGSTPPERDAPYFATPPDRSTMGEGDTARDIIRLIGAADAAFSPKARAWAAFYAAYTTRPDDGRAKALPAWEALASVLDTDTARPYGPAIRRLVAMQRALALQDMGRDTEAEAQATRAGQYATDADDSDGAACAAFTIASIRASASNPAGAADALEGVVGLTDLSSVGRARCLGALAEALRASHAYARARDVTADAAPLLRTTAVGLPTPERSSTLFAAQAAGAEARAELGALDDADVWLNRARSLRPRAMPDAVSDAKLAIAAGLMFIARGRPAMASRRVASLLAATDTPTHTLRRALRVEGQAALQAGDFAAAHATSVRLLECAPTGVPIQDIAAVGWALLTRCEAYIVQGSPAEAAQALTMLVDRVAEACGADPRIHDAEALLGLRAGRATLALRVDAA